MENMQNQENMDLMTEEDLQAAAPSSLWKDAWKRFYKNKTAVVALVVLTLMALAAILAEVIAPYDPYSAELKDVKAPPSAEHWLGCDENGRDILTRSTARAFPSRWASSRC